MITTIESKPCQANNNGIYCEKDARAKCFHCSHDLCLMHLTEHTQYVESQTRTCLYSHEKVLNDLYNELESVSVSSRISEYPFIQLEKWRTDAHKKLDQLAEEKRQEIKRKISEYQIIFTEKTNEQKQKIELLKKQLNDLTRKTHVITKDIKHIEDKIKETKSFLQSIEKHSIKISTYAFFVNIRTMFFDSQTSKMVQSPSPLPTVIQTAQSKRNTRSELKEFLNNTNKKCLDKKRSLSVSLLYKNEITLNCSLLFRLINTIMAKPVKLCQADDNEKCKNEACASCYHCSRDLCLDHLTQHAQLIDALTRSTLEDYFTILTNLSTRLQSLTISTNILNEPFKKIEQWRTDAYRKIDDIVEKKCQEIKIKIVEYRQIFDTIRNEQLEKVARYRQKIAELFRKIQVSNKDMSGLRKSIEQIQNDSNIFDRHSIEVISNRPLIHSIDIRMRLNDWRSSSTLSTSSSSLSSSSVIHQLEFQVKYVRLSGVVTCHYILVEVNGTIGDLIDQFIITQNNVIIGKQKQRDYFLATEVCQRRVRRRFTTDTQLKSIFNKIEKLVLYETPFELNTINLQNYCLILCRFQDGLPWNIKFGLPLLLDVPRIQCRGRDVISALNKILKTCFPLMIANNYIHYEVGIISDEHQLNSATILNQWADEVIDEHLLITDNAMLVVNLVHSSQLSTEKQITDVTRLDGTLKSDDQRRKSRK
ncbi:unnamed protein product [Rotaria magnacalcarata]|uniref:Uncharacterized protein n=3 Tax=Rotaria magnacalcarata TaxID=392030 RepID=A0A816Q9W9_9BILA|nr:unnamed protein product [Rotaria magnacalcarata]CAF2057932.1 unnamed protein product [Rotaria magnacalcarata]CAF3783735.1 unnamed protein product [Rotaria magnacalcarata]CAF3796454.1 unnamed protein product [Rotaria magnacalcarata]CAF3798264.1 unnamed protein product [Rotaria magnacalcarata]